MDLCRSRLPDLGAEDLEEWGGLKSDAVDSLTSVSVAKKAIDPRKVMWVQKNMMGKAHKQMPISNTKYY